MNEEERKVLKEAVRLVRLNAAGPDLEAERAETADRLQAILDKPTPDLEQELRGLRDAVAAEASLAGGATTEDANRDRILEKAKAVVDAAVAAGVVRQYDNHITRGA
jgi:hypothetical protein